MAIVVRKDIRMGKGKMAAQVAHAAVECSMRHSLKVTRWVNEGQKKIVVWIGNEEELIQLMNKAKSIKVHTCPIRDAGMTQVDPNTLTCAAFGPDSDSVIDSLTGQLKLL